MWINTSEEVVYHFKSKNFEIKGYVALWEEMSPSKVVDSDKYKRKYYTIKVVFFVNGYEVETFGEKGSCAQRNTVKFARKQNAVREVKEIVESVRDGISQISFEK